jgi:hypothetical protein
METLLDSTLLTILVIVVIATILALIRTRKRDRCLKHFDGYYVSLTETEGDVTWGEVEVYTSGMEFFYPKPVRSSKGFWQRSLLFYRDQYERMDGIYRYAEGLPEDQKEDRRKHLERTSNPGFLRRFARKVRNWVGMIRDALVQSISLLLGAAKSKTTPAGMLQQDQERMSALSAEIIGHAGNSFDPLLERHLFSRVVVDVSRQDDKTSYCGYLADYTADFLEIIDAQVNAEEGGFGPEAYRPGQVPVDGVEVRLEGKLLAVSNASGMMLALHALEHGAESTAVGAVIPDGFTADLRLGDEIDTDTLEVVIASAERVDMLVPRTRALVRHGVSGLEADELG